MIPAIRMHPIREMESKGIFVKYSIHTAPTRASGTVVMMEKGRMNDSKRAHMTRYMSATAISRVKVKLTMFSSISSNSSPNMQEYMGGNSIVSSKARISCLTFMRLRVSVRVDMTTTFLPLMRRIELGEGALRKSVT